jgi:cytochrome c
MKTGLTAAASILGLILAAPTLALADSAGGTASSGEQLATDKMCFHCHAVKGEKRGPAFEGVARRYAGQEGARARLIKTVQGGTASGSGAMHHWGTSEKMPRDADRVAVSATEAEQLVDYVLSLKK